MFWFFKSGIDYALLSSKNKKGGGSTEKGKFLKRGFYIDE